MSVQNVQNPGFGTPIRKEKISRGQFRDELTNKNSTAWEDLKAEGLETGLPMEALLRKKCGPPEQNRPSNIIYDFMSREEMYPGSSRVRPALTVGQCINTPFRANLMFAHWDKTYDDQFWAKANRNGGTQQFATSVDELPPGSIYRPYGEQRGGEVLNRQRRIPDIALSQIISGTVVQATDLIRGSGFTVQDSAGNLITVPEMGDFPEINFTTDQDASGMQKIGVKLKSSRESKFRESLVQTVDRVVAQVAAMQEHNLSVAALQQIYGTWNNNGRSKITGISENIDGIIDIATRSINGYSIDTLIMNRAQMRQWLATLVTLPASSANATQPGTENRVPGLFGAVEILNDLQAGRRLGYLQDDDASTVGLQTNEMLGFNRMDTLDFYQQAQGMVDEEAYMVPNQSWERVISMIYGQKIWDDTSVAVYVTS